MRQARPVADMGEEISGRENGTGGEAHMLRDHRRMVVAAACQIGCEFHIRQGVWIDGLQLALRGDRGWLVLFIPLGELLAPEFLREDLFGALEALRELSLRSRQDAVVAEPVHIGALKSVDQHPVEAGEVIGALLEGGRMHLLPVKRHRARKMHRVLLP